MSLPRVFWRELRRWRGVLLMGVVAFASIWLAVGGLLGLYIHPRYLVFTVVMAFVALTFVVARLLISGRDTSASESHDGHGETQLHDDEDDASPDSLLQRCLSLGALALATALALGAVLLPPATLSAATATQRDVTATSVSAGGTSVDDAQSADAATFERYTVLEWSSLLAQTSDPAFYDGKPADLVGFVTPSPDAPDDVFYVTRFAITCCAVDAQPIGVPVYMPHWQSRFTADDWVQITGEFGANRSATSGATIALAPTEVTRVDQPDEPYLY